MQQEVLKEIRIKKFYLYAELIELEERIVAAIMNGASPALIEESKILWKKGREFLNNECKKIY